MDILHKIACSMYGYSGMDGAGAIEEFMISHQHDFSVAVTDDLEKSELWFLARCGHGETFYFRLDSYEQGKALAADLFHFVCGEMPELQVHTGEEFRPDARLYLFIHIRQVIVRKLGTYGSREVVRINSLN
jgi:hypothetical protein